MPWEHLWTWGAYFNPLLYLRLGVLGQKKMYAQPLLQRNEGATFNANADGMMSDLVQMRVDMWWENPDRNEQKFCIQCNAYFFSNTQIALKINIYS